MKFTKYMKKSFKRIALIDKCLIIFMTILMIQSIYNLFANESISQETNTIDVVIRTTSAAIFGYFLSANFIKKSTDNNINSVPPEPLKKIKQIELSDQPAEHQNIINSKTNIGFTANATDTHITPNTVTDDDYISNDDYNDMNEISHQQIIIATIIGITSLCVLLAARNFITVTPNMSGTISQLRDFVSGCVGFLLGCPPKSNQYKK